MNCNIKRRIWSRELKETINAFLNRQRESRTETNRGDFNFLITGRGYHRYSFLHKSEHWLPLFTLSSPSPPLSVLLFLFYILFPNLSFSFFWLILSLSVVLLITEKGWRRLRLLISSPLCCVAIETRGWRCMLCFFVSREKQTASSDGRRTEEIRHKERDRDAWTIFYSKTFGSSVLITSASLAGLWTDFHSKPPKCKSVDFKHHL